MPANSRPPGKGEAKDTAPAGLDEYRRKRKAGGTPEPFGGTPGEAPEAGAGLFVVQHHWASRLHYDFRLELGGVLVSWAVAKGPSLDPNEKRMAIHVEDHPIEYAAFEGLIPDGNYGAGPSICWDRGRWVAREDPIEGMKKGKLLFELQGYKLKGLWTIFRTARDPKEWLLVKKPDAFADPGEKKPLPPQSILSGRTVEQLKEGVDLGAELRRELEKLGAPKRTVTPAGSMVMLAERRERAFSDPKWVFEIKYDGYRLIAAREGGKAKLVYRSGRDATATWPDIGATIAALPYEGMILDGEVVSFDAAGRTSFHALQQRGQLQRAEDIRRGAVVQPCTYVAFDLLAVEGYDLRGLPLLERKRLLRRVLPPVGPVPFADHIEQFGEVLYEEVAKRGLEGIVAKKADAPYRPGRSPTWLKVPIGHRNEFAIVGWLESESQNRTGFGSLHIAVKQGKGFLYAGAVGGGFSEKDLTTIRPMLEPLRIARAPCDGPEMPPARGTTWVEPKYVCEVQYKEWPEGRLVRQPIFLGLRPDKSVEETARPGAMEAQEPQAAETEAPPENREFSLSNLNKVFWPDEKITKGDLIEYYQTIAPWMLPYLKDRPVMLTRYPDGIKGKSFFQKDAPAFVPSWLRRVKMWSDENSREVDHFVCEDEDSLVYLANLGTIPFHIWSSRISTLQQPDWAILDLDPKGAPFANVVKVAKHIKALCDEIELPAFIKTSGSTGLHILIPLGAQLVHEQAVSFAQVIATVVATELHEIATVVRLPQDRGGRIYIDYLQNGHGKLLAAPFCVRPVPGACVSTPLKWTEVSIEHPISEFTIHSVPERMKKLKKDPLADVLTLKPDLAGALEKLGKRMKR